MSSSPDDTRNLSWQEVDAALGCVAFDAEIRDLNRSMGGGLGVVMDAWLDQLEACGLIPTERETLEKAACDRPYGLGDGLDDIRAELRARGEL